MRRMMLLAGALFLLSACDIGSTGPDDQKATGSYSLIKFNDLALPVILPMDSCSDDDGPPKAEEINVRGGTAVFTSGSILKVDLDVLFRCGSEGQWQPSDETKADLKYEKDGNSLVLFEQEDGTSTWREMGTAELSSKGMVVIVRTDDGNDDMMKLEFKKN